MSDLRSIDEHVERMRANLRAAEANQARANELVLKSKRELIEAEQGLRAARRLMGELSND